VDPLDRADVRGRQAQGIAEPVKPASFELADAIVAEAYRRYDDHGDLAGYRQLIHHAALVRRRVWRSCKARERIEPSKPPNLTGKGR
jgi:hypothetical protein